MKKLILVLLLLCGCSNEDAMLLVTSQQDNLDHENCDVIKDELQLAQQVNEELLHDKHTFTYVSDKQIDLDEVVRMLSYLIPFDLKLTQTAYLEHGINTYKLNIQYTDTKYSQTITYVKKVLAENNAYEMPLSQKIDFVHDYIINHCEYDEHVEERNEQNESAFQVQGVLFDQLAVCSGYSRSFLLMMRLLDVPCAYVPSDVINHSFNLVYDGDFRFIDVTWDEGDNRYYQLDTDAFFKDGKHQLNKQYNNEYFVYFLSNIYQLT